ncbi:MAG TPA: hypothetical protein PK093_24130 [Phycisphaerae bacterium]|nr:hypothetical protein [Phycisphaerae bacterium]
MKSADTESATKALPSSQPFECPACEGTNAVPWLNPRTGQSTPFRGQVFVRCEDCGERYLVDAAAAMVRFPEYGMLTPRKCTGCGVALPEGRIDSQCHACGAPLAADISATNRRYERKFRDRIIVAPICLVLVLLTALFMWLFPAFDSLRPLMSMFGATFVIAGIEGLLRGQAIKGNIFASRPPSGWQAVVRNIGLILAGATIIAAVALGYVEAGPNPW